MDNTSLLISVIVPTYNPDPKRLHQTLLGLKNQTLLVNFWELIIIDNNSSTDFSGQLDLTWHPNSRIVLESKQGLTNARLKGFENAKADLIVMVDDDNILNHDYLHNAIEFMSQQVTVGSVGGKSIALFDHFNPLSWSLQFLNIIAVRDLGNEIIISENRLTSYPECSPIGAGMVIRKELLKSYVNYLTSDKNQITDRTGNSLASGGDNEINIFILKQHFSVAYSPDLTLLHIIPEIRLSKNYLSKLNYESSCSWVTLLNKHNISPWKSIPALTLPFRYIKAYFKIKAWKSPINYINWRGSCGIFKALSQIHD